ncbi:uncharacterized protein METZ01_LOCUS167440 [marine metagenome]|uniref:RNA polymerase sigma factor 70 region 1.1 domain-containing protein n=1 Tax=marine metagenome TaxID=408172 RepID=A0A382BL61_9ZZZZ
MNEPEKNIRNDEKSQLKTLIAKGKEQGFLTYAEVNDHLPNEIIEPEQIEDIVNMINDMGITVYESPPSTDNRITDAANVLDEDAAAEAAAALANMENEFGRTTDPVRMYMREMGTVDLLTREGEIKIAKRIEEGLHQVLASLSSYPGTILTLLEAYELILKEEIKLSDIVVGFNDTEEYPDEGIVVRNPTEINESDEDEEEEEEDILTPEDFKEHIVKLEKLHATYTKSIKRNGKNHGKTKIAEENLAQLFLELRLAPKFIDVLIDNLSDLIEHIRHAERYVMKICVKESKMPRKDFIASFSGNETNPKWIKTVLKINQHMRKILRNMNK